MRSRNRTRDLCAAPSAVSDLDFFPSSTPSRPLCLRCGWPQHMPEHRSDMAHGRNWWIVILPRDRRRVSPLAFVQCRCLSAILHASHSACGPRWETIRLRNDDVPSTGELDPETLLSAHSGMRASSWKDYTACLPVRWSGVSCSCFFQDPFPAVH